MGKKDDEIVGQLFGKGKSKGSYRESILHYHRPVLEDGEIRYEFFYDPGRVEVFPAIDRAVFVLHPEGVQLHWLTDGGWDRTEITPDNQSALPDGGALTEQLPLQENEWNQVRLSIEGDLATLTLNDQAVARYALSPDNQRLFGLFRYSSETTARVRKVVYRGDWATELPSVDEQELAWPSTGPVAMDEEKLAASVRTDLAESLDKLAASQIKFTGAEGTRHSADGVSKLSLPNDSKKGQAVGYEMETGIRGDFQITATIDSFTLADSKDKSAHLALVANLVEPTGRNAASLDWVLLGDGQRHLSPTRHLHWPDGSQRTLEQVQPLPNRVTKLRLIRKGVRIWYLAATEDEPEFQLVDSFVFGDADVESVGVYVVAVDESSTGRSHVGHIGGESGEGRDPCRKRWHIWL